MTLHAYAIKQNGAINVRSVSPTDIGAKVNWLCTDCYLPLRAGLTDATVNRVFESYAVDKSATCVVVTIEEAS